jgi:predicted  nucleic acid-binding Zn-ribbon protein
MNDHIPDATKMISDTPRTDAEAFLPHDSKYRVCDADFARQLERELNAANDRIKRLEEDLMDAKNQYAVLVADVALYEDRGERIKQLEEALWLKQPISTAKEDKP